MYCHWKEALCIVCLSGCPSVAITLVYMCVCVCVCIDACVYVCVCMYMCVYLLLLSLSLSLCMCVCVCVYLVIYVSLSLSLSLCICVCACVCVCVETTEHQYINTTVKLLSVDEDVKELSLCLQAAAPVTQTARRWTADRKTGTPYDSCHCHILTWLIYPSIPRSLRLNNASI